MEEVFGFCPGIRHKSEAHWDTVSLTEREECMLSGEGKGKMAH